MSTFHGGYLVTRIDPNVQELARRPVAEYLRAAGIPLDDLRLAFATRRGSPWLLVALRGGPADGKGGCFFHYEHLDLGGAIARALGAPVVAYAYENQTGFEATSSFDASGRVTSREEAAWDELAEELGVVPGTPDAAERLRRALPLGRLTGAHAVPRALLEDALAYDTPACVVPLVGDADPSALARYLDGPLLSLPRAPRVEPAATTKVYFDSVLLGEAERLSSVLGVSISVLFAAAWEHGKARLFETSPGVEGEPCLPTPAAFPPTELVLPDTAHELGPLQETDGKVLTALALEPRAIGEIEALAAHLDRTKSWVLRRAWHLTRERLHAASRPR
ncbi:MAG: hypothetical protein MUE69_22685 [Myxococcota bacterium]|jgi:hypothetical protein|nr:hypothetical protein [Myxococcota bacterium]